MTFLSANGRTVGPLTPTRFRILLLFILAVISFLAWLDNRRVAIFFCSDEAIGQGRSCFGIQGYVDWHTAIVTATMLWIAVTFKMKTHFIVAYAIIVVFTVDGIAIIVIWALSYFFEHPISANYIFQLSKINGIFLNTILYIGVYFFFIILSIKKKR